MLSITNWKYGSKQGLLSYSSKDVPHIVKTRVVVKCSSCKNDIPIGSYRVVWGWSNWEKLCISCFNKECLTLENDFKEYLNIWNELKAIANSEDIKGMLKTKKALQEL